MTTHASRVAESLASTYRLEREIGRGGMATVYLAYDLERDRRVAVKVLHEELSVALGHERFRREIQIAAQLTHPNILPVYDSGSAGEALFLVMPYLDGGSLRSRIDRERQLVLDDVIAITTQIANALDFAHRQGVVHRDVKPENILFADGHAFVADFGIARAINQAGEDRITRSGITLGTPLYMSPEQAAAQQDLDGRSDVYSLGCCVYEMLAGSPPFTGPTAQVITARHSLEQVPSLFIARRGVPEQVEATVMRALAKAPADRFRTAAEFADALNGRISVSMPRTSGGTRAVAPARWAPRFARVGLAITGIAAAALGAKLWLGHRPAVASTSELDPRRIAVPYFEDRSGGRLAYLSDGLTEALIGQLRGVRDLNVVSPNGVRQFRNAPPDSVARALSAGTIVLGSVEPVQGDSIRVSIRLVEGASGVDFKRASFVGAAGNALRVRDEVAARAAEFLRARLGEEIRLQAERRETTNPTAWALLQQAERLNKDAERAASEDSLGAAFADFARADSLLESTESLDPRWAAPVVLRGTLAYRRARLVTDRLRASTWIETGMQHAQRALALDPRDADAVELRGTLRYLRWLLSLEPDPTRAAALLRDAEADLRTAVSISPSNASAWSTLSHLEYQKPDLTEAKLAAQRAYEEDAYLAVAPDIVWRLYTTSYDLEDVAGAAQWCAEGRKRFPDNPRFVECRIWLMSASGSRPDVVGAWEFGDSLHRMLEPRAWGAQWREIHLAIAAAIARAALVDSANRAILADSARRVVVRARADRTQDPDGELLGLQAFVSVLLGDRDEAFRSLKEYFAINPSHRALFARTSSWWWRPLRADPRFGELVGFADR
jgi:serine/threonine-protein kinase